jgi:hypothetical protein
LFDWRVIENPFKKKKICSKFSKIVANFQIFKQQKRFIYQFLFLILIILLNFLLHFIFFEIKFELSLIEKKTKLSLQKKNAHFKSKQLFL